MDKTKKPVYIRCPRCELNYIQKRDKVCSVCKKELMAIYNPEERFDNELEFDLEVCPICKTNYMRADEEVCEDCAKERKLSKTLLGESDADWEDADPDGDDDQESTEADELGHMVGVTNLDDDEGLGIPELDLDIGIDDDEELDFEDDMEEAESDLEDDLDDFDDIDLDDDEEDDLDDDDEEDDVE